jgi:hypothetical protein
MKKRWDLIHDFIILLEKWRKRQASICINSFHVDKFHLKPKNIKNLEHFTKVSKNTEQFLYIDVLINPDNYYFTRKMAKTASINIKLSNSPNL